MSNFRGSSSETPDEATDSDSCVCSVANPVEHYVTGVLGFIATLLLGMQVYPWLRAIGEPSSYLASTWLVFSFAAIWLVCWIVLEVAWEWRAGRVHLP